MPALVHVANLDRLRSRVGLSPDDLCNFYDVIPSDGDDARYAQIFLNPAANGRIANDFLPANVAGNEAAEIALPGSGKKLNAYTDYVALCLGARQTDCEQLIAAFPAPAILSFANLAAVYSRNLLAKTLKLTAAEILILESLTGVDVLNAPADTLAFIAKMDKVLAAGVKPADLQYLLRHQADDLGARILSDAAISGIQAGLQAGYQTAFVANQSPFNPAAAPDENKNAARDLLAKLPTLAEADLSLFQNLFDDNWTDPAITPPNFIDQMLAAY